MEADSRPVGAAAPRALADPAWLELPVEAETEPWRAVAVRKSEARR